MALKTLAASAAAASFRIVLMPVDALKTTLQVEGAGGLKHLATKVRVGTHAALQCDPVWSQGCSLVCVTALQDSGMSRQLLGGIARD